MLFLSSQIFQHAACGILCYSQLSCFEFHSFDHHFMTQELIDPSLPCWNLKPEVNLSQILDAKWWCRKRWSLSSSLFLHRQYPECKKKWSLSSSLLFLGRQHTGLISGLNFFSSDFVTMAFVITSHRKKETLDGVSKARLVCFGIAYNFGLLPCILLWWKLLAVNNPASFPSQMIQSFTTYLCFIKNLEQVTHLFNLPVKENPLLVWRYQTVWLSSWTKNSCTQPSLLFLFLKR